YYKRRHNIKDFSNLIPAHGGVLDRFDSWIFAGAMFYFFTL
ncbi:MAG: phosphatidate cytidylyltransferase, partial [Chitinophagales bacterium]